MKYPICYLIGALFSIQAASATPLELHIDADYSISTEAAQSIELGVKTALAEVENTVAGSKFIVVPKDHRGNVKRSHRTMKQSLENENALAIIGGLHSPPYLAHRDFINQSEILLLLPWSAAGPITRPAEGQENWIFRLSVDDFRTGEFFMREAVDKGGCTKVGLLLVDTGWGRANAITLRKALNDRGMEPSITTYIPASGGSSEAVLAAEDIARTRSDCIIILSNWDNGSKAINALHDRMKDIRVFSHWGIMGGDFAGHVPHQTREALQIEVLQTCGLRREKNGNSVLTAALKQTNAGYRRLSDISAPTGFTHGYDLAKVLIAAVKQASKSPDWGKDIRAKRRAVRHALEQLDEPVDGILKTYEKPFSAYSPDNIYAHEALGVHDLCFARFAENGELVDMSN